MATKFADLNGNMDDADPLPDPAELDQGPGDDAIDELAGRRPGPIIEDEEVVIIDDGEDEQRRADADDDDSYVDDDGKDEGGKKLSINDRLTREKKAKEKWRGEADKLRAENAKLRATVGKAAGNAEVSRLEAEIQKAKDLRAAAKFETGPDAEEKADNALMTAATLTAELNILKRSLAADSSGEDAPDTGGKKPNRLADRWVEKNEHWWDDRRFVHVKAAVQALDSKLAKEGDLETTDPEYFRELDRRIKEAGIKIPKGADDADDRSGRAPPSRGGGPARVGSVSTGAPAQRNQRRSALTLTTRDLAQMKVFGLDPRNKSHLARFAKERNSR